MHTKTIFDYIANKDNSNSEARKYIVVEGKRIGPLESLILDFAGKHVLIQAASVREYLKQQDIEASLKRIHDALQRLLKKGIIEKVSRGVYKLTEYGKKLLSALRGKESGFKAARCCGCGNVFADGGGFYRARLHVRGGRGLEDLARQLYALYSVVRCALVQVRRLLGRSRFYRVVRGVSVVCVDSFVGGHGTSALGRGRSLKRPLIDLSYFQSLGLKPLEIGVDVFAVVLGGVEPSVKVYFG
jgi:DNA-binding PadR family transcriptional regulator